MGPILVQDIREAQRKTVAFIHHLEETGNIVEHYLWCHVMSYAKNYLPLMVRFYVSDCVHHLTNLGLIIIIQADILQRGKSCQPVSAAVGFRRFGLKKPFL
jgi:hypothetical protein